MQEVVRHRGRRRASSRCLWPWGLAALGIGLAVPHPTEAHVGDRVFPIYELPSSDLPDLHDGTLEDWEAVLLPSLDQRDFAALILDGNEGGRMPVPQERLAFAVYLAWHSVSQRIFVAIQRFDEAHTLRLPPEPGELWDSVELFIDGDHGGDLCTASRTMVESPEEIERMRQIDNVKCQVYMAVPEAQGPRRIAAYGYSPLWAVDPPYVDAGGYRFGESPSLSGYEVYLTPWDELQYDLSDSRRTRLEPGAIIGFQIGVFDTDDTVDWARYLENPKPPVPYSIYTVAGWLTHWGSRFADGLLVPCKGEDCSGGPSSAVEPVSWGRIKAAFER